MNEDLHDIDDLFKKGLDEHSEIPPKSVWENIDKSLDKKKVISISKKYYKLKWAAAVLLLFSIGMAMYTLHINKRNKELVKQSDEKNILKRSGSRTKSNSIDSLNITNTNGHSNTNTAGNKPSQKDRYAKSSIPESKEEIIPSDTSISKNDNSERVKRHLPANLISKNENNNQNLASYDSSGADVVVNSKAIKTNEPSTKSSPVRDSPVNGKDQKRPFSIQRSNASIANPHNEVPSIEKEKNLSTSTSLDINENKTTQKSENELSTKNVTVTRERNIEGVQLLPALLYNIPVDYEKIHLRFEVAPSGQLASSKTIRHERQGKSNFKVDNPHPLTATLFVSPNIVSTNIKNEEIHYREEDRREIEKNEKNNLSSTIGVLLNYSISRKLQLQSGITFSSWVTNIEPKKIYARPDAQGNINYRFNCAAGYSYLNVNSTPNPAPGDSLEALRSNNTLQYLAVPIELKYNLGKKRFSVTPGLGLVANFLTKGQIKTTIATNIGNIKASSSSIEGLKPMYLAGIADITFQYNLSKTLSLAFIPSSRFSLSSINKNAPVKTNLYYLGFSGGVVIKL